MTFAELQAALGIALPTGSAKIDRQLGQGILDHVLVPFYGGGEVRISAAVVESQTEPEVVVRGTAPFLAADLREGEGAVFLKRTTGLPVRAVCRVTETGEVTVSIEFTLPETWSFTDNFPALPLTFDPDGADLPLPVYLAATVGRIENPRFTLRNSLPGLSFEANWTPSGAFGALEKLLPAGAAPRIKLSGHVVLPVADVPALGDGQFPWEKPAPGLHLRADLGIDRTLGKQLRLRSVAFRSYSPLDAEFVIANPSYQAAMGFSGELTIPSLGQGVAVAVHGRRLPSVDAVQVAGEVSGVNFANLGGAFEDLAGTDTAIDLIPGDLQSGIGDLSLSRVTALIESSDSSFRVSQIGATIELGLSWPPPGSQWPFGSVSLTEAQILVIDPFTANRSVSATLDGELSIPAAKDTVAKFDLTATAPEFEVSAELSGPATIALRDFFNRHLPGVPPPPAIDVTEAAVAASKDGSFRVALRLGGSAGWQVDTTNSVPSVHVAISNSGWEFSGESSAGVPILALFAKLGQELGIDPGLPGAIDALRVHSFSVARDNASRLVTVSCSGSLQLAELPAPIAITLDAEPHNRKFSGRIHASGLVFDLKLAGSMFVASYHFQKPGDDALPGALQSKVSVITVLEKLGLKSIAGSLPAMTVEINDAFLAFRKASASGKSRLLFAFDAGGKIDLTGKAFDELKKLGIDAAEELKLGVRLLVASEGLTSAEAVEVNALLPVEIDGLPTGERSGNLAVSKGLDAALRMGRATIGQEPDDLPADEGEPAPAKVGRPGSDVKWFNVQRTLGPLHIKRVGVRLKDERICFLLDAGISMAGLSLGLDGLEVCNPMREFKPAVDLRGLSIGYSGGPVQISGAFLKVGSTQEFAGTATIRTPQLSLTAIGSYILTPPSLFVFAALDYPIGGPSFFFVTGVAAGFGYNRDITMPAIGDVERFPFVRAVLAPPASPNPGLVVLNDLIEQKLVRPLAGSYWLAAGIRFSSFQLIDSFALLLVKFGRDLEFALIGLSRMTLPKRLPTDPPDKPKPIYLQVELAIRVAVKPNEGVFAAEALLTQNSFVIDKSCRLTGGFAFYFWFGGSHKGDFVLTLGGYHPRFNPPAHYPKVPRLGINWVVSKLTIKGEAYFALTPSCIMAGGGLEASYRDGGLEASFTIRANFLIRWEPFFYDIDVSISLKAAYVMSTVFGDLRLGTELSASIQIWGPEFAGIARVTWTVISFDVEFGAIEATRKDFVVLDWATFRDAFLPKPEPGNGWTGPAADGPLQICQVNIERGLDREVKVGNRTHWVVKPDELELSTQTAVPATSLAAGSKSVVGRDVGIRPMGGGPFESEHKIRVFKGVEELTLDNRWAISPRFEAVPAELWSDEYKKEKPPPSATLIPGALVGASGLRPLAAPLTGAVNVPIGGFDPLPDKLLPLRRADLDSPVGAILAFGVADVSGDAFDLVRNTVGAMENRRNRLILLARDNGFRSLANGSLDRLVSGVQTIFQSPPLLGALGSGGSVGQRPEAEPPLRRPEPDREVIETVITLLISVLQFAFAEAEGESEEDLDAKVTRHDVQFSLAARPSGVLEAAEVDTESEVPRHTIVHGKTLVWEIGHTDRRGARRTAIEVEQSEGLRLRVTVLDRFRRPLKDLVLSGLSTTQRFNLPVEAARVTVTALAEPAAPVAGGPALAPAGSHGWIDSSSLIQLDPHTFVVDGVTVRTQYSYRGDAADLDVGVLRGSAMIRRNRKAGETGAGRSGWFSTSLPASARTLAVLVRRGTIEAEPGASTLVEVTRADGATLSLMPVHVFSDGTDRFVLLYRIPDGLKHDEAGSTAFLAQARGGPAAWEIHGVIGIDERVARVRTEWDRFRLQSSILGTAPVGQPLRGEVAIVAA